MNVLSLFDGISCARVAFERAEITIDKYYASEVDKYAIQVARRNYSDTIQIGDVCSIVKGMVDRIDLVIGGSPCQDLSIAKKNRKGLAGERSGLFWEYVRILKVVKPDYFILENVFSMPKAAKNTITEVLCDIEPVMIDASLVSGQSRKRLFWVGKRNGRNYEQVEINQPEDQGIFLKDVLQPDAEVDLCMCVKGKGYPVTVTYMKAVPRDSLKKKQRTMVRVGQIGKGGQGERVYSPEGKSSSLNALGGGRGAKTGLYYVTGVAEQVEGRKAQKDGTYKRVLEKRGDGKGNAITSVLARNQVYISKTGVQSRVVNGKLINSKDKTHQQDLLQSAEGKWRTIPAGTHGSTPHLLKTIMPDGVIRKLTPMECERLQGLPDRYTEKGINDVGEEIAISNTQRYKILGNAFNVDVVAHILKGLNL